MWKSLLGIILFLSIPGIISLFVERVKRERNSRIKRVTKTQEMTFAQNFNRLRKFAIKTSTKKQSMLIIFLVALGLSAIIPLYKLFLGILYSLLAPFIVNTIYKSKIGKELEDQDTLMDRMIQFKQTKMGLVNSKSNKYNYEEEFKILELDENDRKPSKIIIYLPPTFDPLGSTRFIDDFSIQFGRERPFEIDYENKDYSGWDTDKGGVVLYLEKPLPTIAIWDEHYITDPNVQWSYFPLGLSSKGGIPLENPETGEIERVVGYDVDGTQSKFCAKNGIVVGNDIVQSPMALGCGSTGGGKSVAINIVMTSALMRGKKWQICGLDMKKVELSRYRKFGVPVATTLEDCALLTAKTQSIMMDRYAEMEKLGVTNYEDVPEDRRGRAIMLVVDEAAELLAPVAGKDEESKDKAALQDQIRSCLESIARLGRASQIFLILFAQRPSSELISMQIRNNCSTRLAYGTIGATVSGMVFENTEGARIKGKPRGRAGIKINENPVIHFQGFFSPDNWLEEYLKSKGLPIKIYEDEDTIERKNEKPEIQEEMSQAEFEAVNRAVEDLLKQAE